MPYQRTPTDLTLTVLDTATIYEGPTTVYRYDLPGHGITEGWAADAVVDQIRELLNTSWPKCVIEIDAQPSIIELLEQPLSDHGVRIRRRKEQHKKENTTADHTEDITKPISALRRALNAQEQTRRGRHQKISRRIEPLYIAMALVICIVGAVAWWSTDAALNSDDTKVAVGESKASEQAAASATTSAPIHLAGDMIAEHERIRVTLPRGYVLALKPNDSSTVVATGPDPELRILLSVEPIDAADPPLIHQEIRNTIDLDPVLSLREDRLAKNVPVLAYQETPDDGSTIAWWAWVENKHLFSVGCHSKTAQKVAHKAACRKAAETVHIKQ
ncbi:type VII secretion-associated protein [Corynebacterium diphtheriae]|uniref:type VII secretion-associated protein n=1 Tax=Corynebacterium diphtheriae TaxID=1717 RepID=UPI0013CB8787|nr:type VII secretion-associated protein [Corynebacterium diphtheriae]MBG9311829.1 type VII secretion-associated protein [Corynebacterium diphtheriae bv. mitis]CAB0682539.1 type VII secretion-associated protein [Corynebacterium diphtheriae]CAB0682872.1 type VII secretion-associated protein [Corynebacterium diphtheriae]CAB0683093.1 type VII secretion-associated protein [Corynebacterium diphtheriae]CAB0683116.1 type VII secretion-associated protein [Corynebacterium diphtheriae]